MDTLRWRVLPLFAAMLLASTQVVAQTDSRPLPPAPFCVGNVCSEEPVPQPSAGARKWHPGHYVSIIPNLYASDPDTLGTILKFVDRIASEPTIKGIQVFGYWGQFEGSTAGDYKQGFATIDAILARCQQHGKYLMLNIMGTVFGASGSDHARYFPAYLVNGSSYGISVFGDGRGLQTRLWQPATADRLIALMKAYGARYDSHPNLEMVALGETSVNVAVGVDGYSFNALDTQLKRQMTATRAAFPKTGIRLGANFYFSDANTSSLLDHARSLEIAVGGPDVLPKQRIQANQVFSGAVSGSKDYRGVIPFVSEVQSPELGGKEGTYTNEQLYLSAMEGISTASGGATGSGTAVFRAVRPQYFVWYYNTWSGGDEQKWATGTLPFVRRINGAVSSTACPSGYSAGCWSN